METGIEYLTNARKYSDYTPHPTGGTVHSLELTTPPELAEIFAPYDLPTIAGNGDTLSRALNIMQWITDHSVYDGASMLRPTTSDKIIAHAFDKGEAGCINCANKSILLTDALTHIGVFALPMALLGWILDPESPSFGHASSHVVTHVFLPELNKWVVLDPSFNTYIVDKDFRPLNIVEIADAHRNGLQMFAYDIGEDQLAFKGLACLLYSLPQIQIWRGNDYAHRVGAFTWDTAYWLASENTLRQAEYLLANKELKDYQRDWLSNLPNLTQISVEELLAAPH
ncbi:MAG: hypothetical protein FWG38_05050 [Defluviitaleaceae bacterium]|nr:hypothetical protein [Defluviitaleaceae bacterium]